MANNERVGSDIDRRTLMKGAVATGGTIGVGGLVVAATGTQENEEGTITAEECEEQFTGGPQVQQCISCIEDACGAEEEAFPLFPLFTGLDGQCFSPEEIPEGADYVALKAAQNCYIAPVDGYTRFCVPDGAPDISNATFYRCGGEPTPMIVEKTVTCDAITVTTENIPDNTTLTATVTFADDSQQTISEEVVGDQVTFALPGDLDPVFVVITLNDQVIDEQEIEAEDAPCFDPDPTIVEKSVTCEAITVTTENIADNTSLTATVTFVDADGVESEQTITAAVVDDQATFALPGDLNPVFVVITLNEQVIDEQAVDADDAPCFDPKDPKDPKEPENRKEAKKKMKKYKKKLEKCDDDCEEYERKYEKYKKMYEEMK